MNTQEIIQNLQNRITELEQFISNKKVQQISYPIDDISMNILSNRIGGTLLVSAKGSTSENQAVNESGSASYSVLKSPDIYLQITINGTNYFIPAFT